jgi:hypothetical protein
MITGASPKLPLQHMITGASPKLQFVNIRKRNLFWQEIFLEIAGLQGVGFRRRLNQKKETDIFS